MTQATVSLSSAESEAKTIPKGCSEALNVKHLLEHQTARPFKIEVWTDSSSAKAIHATAWTRAQIKTLGGADDVGSNVDLISLIKLDTMENVADLLTKHVPRTVLDKPATMTGYTFPGEETQKFQEYANINQNYWNQKIAAVEKLPVFDDGENEEFENDVHSISR